MSFLSKLLGFISTPDEFGYKRRGSDQAQVAQNADMSKSLLSRIAPNMNTKVNATALSGHKMQAGKAASQGQVKQNMAAVTSVKKDAQAMQGQIMDCVKEIQRDLMAATKACGYDNSDVFPDNRDGASGEAGLVFSLVLETATGGKAIAQAAASSSKIGDIIDSAKKGRINYSNALSEINEQLVKMSCAPSATEKAGMSGNNGGGDAVPIPKTRFDYSQVTHNDIKTIAYTNPENAASSIPEFAEALDVEQKADCVIENLLGAEKAIPKCSLSEEYKMCKGSLFDMKGLKLPDRFDCAVGKEELFKKDISVAELKLDVPLSLDVNAGSKGI